MLDVVEVVIELQAEGFINSDRQTAGKVVRHLGTGAFSCRVEASVKGVPQPKGPYASEDEARRALIQFWENCNKALERTPAWTPLTFV
ncbi:hypothetical protein [Pseudomonas sp. CM27]|uniref:hypothetical protein n=1 Tax=Pseudomonas sp. CM27 TaxID=2738452 RepID=UPI0015566A7E|nr:hypothetical protein [Pseudomonas sp. CM27]NQD72902.1 hypothetical protein [Pseudomonas sp. CM27]